MTHPDSKIEGLYELIRNVQQGSLGVRNFCEQFERRYNLEIDKTLLLPRERAAFSKLFHRIVWYSPSPEERASIPNYIGEEEVRAAVAVAERELRQG